MDSPAQCGYPIQSCLTVELRNQSYAPGWDLQHWFFWFSSLHTRLNYTLSSPGSSMCKWQSLGLLRCHSPLNQFLIINLSIYLPTYLHTYLSPISSVTLEHWTTKHPTPSHSQNPVLWLCAFFKATSSNALAVSTDCKQPTVVHICWVEFDFSRKGKSQRARAWARLDTSD